MENKIEKDFIALEDMLKTIHSGSKLALVRLATAMEKLKNERQLESEETALRS